MSIAALGGATLDNEENYLIKKLLTSLGVIQVENQARVCHSSTVVGLGTSFGRGASSTLPGDLQHSDLIVLEGSNMAEAHPVAFQWVVEAKARGATVIHIDPHYSRTSALADMFVPIRAGSDIAFLGGVINHVLSGDHDFREYVLAYTNAPTIIGEEFSDADADGLFSGFDPDTGSYDPVSWQYERAFVGAASGQRDQEGELRGRRPQPTVPAVMTREPGRGWIRRSSTRAACGRSSSVTTRATPRRWWSASAASPATCSSRCASCSSRTRAASGLRRSCTGSAGLSTRSAPSTSAARRSCSCCLETWVARAAV